MTAKNYIKRHLESVLANTAETFKFERVCGILPAGARPDEICQIGLLTIAGEF